MRSLLILSLVVFPVVAKANCPTQKDLQTGITLTRNNPLTQSTFKTRGSELSEDRVLKRAGATERISQSYGHALAPLERRAPSGKVGFSYSGSLAQLSSIKSVKEIILPSALSVNGRKVDSGTTTFTYVRTKSLRIGKCRYKTWVVDVTSEFQKIPGSTFRQFYAYELGLVVRTDKLDTNNRPISRVAFDSIKSVAGE